MMETHRVCCLLERNNVGTYRPPLGALALAAQLFILDEVDIDTFVAAGVRFIRESSDLLREWLKEDKASFLSTLAEKLQDSWLAGDFRQQWPIAKTLLRFGGRSPKQPMTLPLMFGDVVDHAGQLEIPC